MDYHEDLFNSEYYEIFTNASELKLLIVGRDPYPKGAINIAMCKKDWKEMSDKRNSGRAVLISLFGDLYDDVIGKYKNPTDLGFYLAKNGIGFSNASFERLDTKWLSKKRHFHLVNLNVNISLFEKAEKVLLCGDASKMIKWHNEFDHFQNMFSVPHPSLQSRNRLLDKQKWDNVWADGKLSHYLNL